MGDEGLEQTRKPSENPQVDSDPRAYFVRLIEKHGNDPLFRMLMETWDNLTPAERMSMAKNITHQT